ncbi:gata zinc finger domain-containing protein 10-related [Anaeramoeba flamelloides]|uniref:Gata zinc finger domain-containing protein 10-related n=1 Tax=Anaeramoeba flamelloides TaxID=1746091 RepID=A0AAV7YCE3_9EUKA|nr:gata zinc finger domain-containing protein 10-related [Anaeramoeba flamelloides]
MDQSISMDLQKDKPFYFVKENICKQFKIEPQNLITYPIDPRDDSISVGDIIQKNPQILTIINTNIVYLGDEVSEFEPTIIDLTPKQRKKRIIQKQIETEHSFFSNKKKEKTKTKKNFLKKNNQFLSKTPKPKTTTNPYRKTRALPKTNVKPQITRISKMTLNKLRPKTETISRSRTRITTGSMMMNKKQKPLEFKKLNFPSEIKKPKVNKNKKEKVEKKENQDKSTRNTNTNNNTNNNNENENKNKKIVNQFQPKKKMNSHNVRKFKKIVRQLKAVRSTGNKILDLLLKYQIKNVGQNPKLLEQFHQSFIGHPIISTQPLSKLLHYSSITKFNRPLLLYLYNNKIDPNTNRVVQLLSDNIFINLINSYYHFWVVDLYKLRLPSYIRKQFEITRYPCFYKVQINKEKIRCMEWKQRYLNKDTFIDWLVEILTEENKTKWNKLKELLGTDFSEYVNEEELDFKKKENLFDDLLKNENINQTKENFLNDDIDFDNNDFNLEANKELRNEDEDGDEYEDDDENEDENEANNKELENEDENLDLINKNTTSSKVQKKIIKEEKNDIIFEDELDLNFDFENSQKKNPMKKLLDLSSLYNDFIHKNKNKTNQIDENQKIKDEKNFQLSSGDDNTDDDENFNEIIDNGSGDDENLNENIDRTPIKKDNFEKRDINDNKFEFINENNENVIINENEIINTNENDKEGEKDNEMKNEFEEIEFENDNEIEIENENENENVNENEFENLIEKENFVENEFENDKKIDQDEEKKENEKKDEFENYKEIEDEDEDEEEKKEKKIVDEIEEEENIEEVEGEIEKKVEKEEIEEKFEHFEHFENKNDGSNVDDEEEDDEDDEDDDELINVTIKVIGQNNRYSKEFKKNDNLLEIINWINDLFPTIAEFSIWIRENKKWITPENNEYDLLSGLGIEDNSLLIIQGSIL